MTESEFNDRVDATLMQIEDAIDASDAEIDYETVGGILTLTFENDSKVIINRQGPLQQLWVAAKSGGFHLNYDAKTEQWLADSNGESLEALLNRVCREQSDEETELSL